MKFETSIEQLRGAVSVATRFTERRANLPVLGSVLIAAEGGRLILRATNLECGIEIVVPAKIESEGIVAVPAPIFSGFLSGAQGKSISCSLEGTILSIKTDRAAASIKILPHEDFPILPRVSAEKSFSIKSADLVRALRSVVNCASTSTVKPELQSVLLGGDVGKLTVAATDSFRLAEKSVPRRGGGQVPALLLPARNAAELIRLLEGIKTEVEIYYNDNQLSAQLEGTYYTSRLIDGAFPNYQQIVPKTFTTEAVVLREDFSSALKSLAIFSDKFSQVSLAIEPSKKAVLLSSRNPDVGEQTSTVKATIVGEMSALSFNNRYLSDGLSAIVGESVRLHSNGPGKALLIKDAADESFFYLAMPMNR
jgi:DNA polymerase III subunit beta